MWIGSEVSTVYKVAEMDATSTGRDLHDPLQYGAEFAVHFIHFKHIILLE